MKCIHLFTVLLSLNVTLAKYKWSDWSTKVSCARLCSQQQGVKILKRECQQCTNDNCVRTHDYHCSGTATKTESCYNPNECVGRGLYRGAWSPWSTGDSCPPDKEACRGAARYFVRRCLHRSLQVSDEVFKCPDIPTEKLEFCPCVGTASSTWSQWTQWTECGCSSRIRSRMRRCWKMNDEACKGDGTESRGCTPDEVKCRSVTGRGNAAALSQDTLKVPVLVDVRNILDRALDSASAYVSHEADKRVAPAQDGLISDSQAVVSVKVIESTGPIFEIKLPEVGVEGDRFEEPVSRNSSTGSGQQRIAGFGPLPILFGCVVGWLVICLYCLIRTCWKNAAARRDEESRLIEVKTPYSSPPAQPSQAQAQR